MMIYALGAFARFSFEYHIDRVRMTIVQPRIDNLSEWKLSIKELTNWTETVLIPAAEKPIRETAHRTPAVGANSAK